MEDVPGRKSQDSVTSVDQSILPPVVFDEGCAMRHAVVFEGKSRLEVAHIWPRDEHAGLVSNGRLHCRCRQAVRHKKHSQSRFHGTLAAGIGKRDCPSEQPDAPVSRMASNPRIQHLAIYKAGSQRHVEHDDAIDKRTAACKVSDGSGWRRNRQAADFGCLVTVVVRADERNPGEMRARAVLRQRHLDWIAGNYIESVKPSRGSTGEECVTGHAPEPGDEPLKRHPRMITRGPSAANPGC